MRSARMRTTWARAGSGSPTASQGLRRRDKAPPDHGDSIMQPHLGELFEISTLLTRFEDLEAVHLAVVDTMARAVPLHAEVLVWADDGGEPRTLHWLAPHGDSAD